MVIDTPPSYSYLSVRWQRRIEAMARVVKDICMFWTGLSLGIALGWAYVTYWR